VTRRALILDLDDTLYRERRFALSGFCAVATVVDRQDGIPGTRVFARLAAALRSGRRAGAFQELADHFGLPRSRAVDWLEVYRSHQPRLRLPRESEGVLRAMRKGWRLGVLTNGMPSIQARKIEALGLGPMLDAVVFAEEFDGGKPHPAAFIEVLRRLDCAPEDSVCAGDDLLKDIAGAKRVGLRTVLLARGDSEDPSAVIPDATIRTLSELPQVVERLVGGGTGV
jgi:putative hydrolase of the HAD superfamily